jgi:hypothetical protein
MKEEGKDKRERIGQNDKTEAYSLGMESSIDREKERETHTHTHTNTQIPTTPVAVN